MILTPVRNYIGWLKIIRSHTIHNRGNIETIQYTDAIIPSAHIQVVVNAVID